MFSIRRSLDLLLLCRSDIGGLRTGRPMRRNQISQPRRAKLSSRVKFFAVVGTLHFDRHTHLIQTRTQSYPNAVLESFFPIVLTLVGIVRREDSRLLVVVTSVDDVSHRVANPVRW